MTIKKHDRNLALAVKCQFFWPVFCLCTLQPSTRNESSTFMYSRPFHVKKDLHFLYYLLLRVYISCIHFKSVQTSRCCLLSWTHGIYKCKDSASVFSCIENHESLFYLHLHFHSHFTCFHLLLSILLFCPK